MPRLRPRTTPRTRTVLAGPRWQVGREARDRGAAAIEFALVVPLLLTLFVGIAEFGRAFSTEAALSQAARQGVRALASNPTEAAARTAAQQAASELNLTAAEITVRSATCAAPATTASVTVSRQQPFLTGIFGSAITLTGTAVMRCSR